MENTPRQPIKRHRRIQLVKYLIEEKGLNHEAIQFDENGFISNIKSENTFIQNKIDEGLPLLFKCWRARDTYIFRICHARWSQ